MKRKGIFGIVCAIDALLLAGCIYLYVNQDRTAPVISFSNEEIVYTDGMDEEELLSGVSAYDEQDGDVSYSLLVEKISNAVIDKRLSQIKDNEEERLIEDLLYLFGELDQFVSISSFNTENGEVYNINVASNTDSERISRTIILPETEKPKVERIMSSIQGLLTGDANIDSCILMKLLNNNMKK